MRNAKKGFFLRVSHVVAEANERRLYSQAMCKTASSSRASLAFLCLHTVSQLYSRMVPYLLLLIEVMKSAKQGREKSLEQQKKSKRGPNKKIKAKFFEDEKKIFTNSGKGWGILVPVLITRLFFVVSPFL